MSKLYQIKTFGCAMNHSDSERISAFLEKSDFKLAKNHEKSDLIIFNTCGIKQAPEDRIYSLINNIRKKDKHCLIVLTGCLALRNDVQKRLKEKVDFFCEIKKFPEKMERYILQTTKNNLSKEIISYLTINPKHTNNFQAYVPIMTGCNNFCTYCVVPHARGREISRKSEEIIAEIRGLVSKNYRHIILLGQNVNSYQGEKSLNFAKLLKKINALPGKFWISFVSSHPKDMSTELIETIAKSKKILENVHLPIQAGNNEILQKMNRKYTREHYLELLRKIKSAFKKYKPDAEYSLTSDIIVGFPGETRNQFSASALVMKKARFDMVFFGQYSPRPETKAFQMKDTVSKKEKKRREIFLNEILKKTALKNSQRFLHKKIEVLIEKEKNGIYFGKTKTLKNIKLISNKKNLVGNFVKVKITKANIWNLEGILL